jgi:hypothetical protein
MQFGREHAVCFRHVYFVLRASRCRDCGRPIRRDTAADCRPFLSSATPRYVLTHSTNPGFSDQDLGFKGLTGGRPWLLLVNVVIDSGDFRLRACTRVTPNSSNCISVEVELPNLEVFIPMR